MSSNFEFQKFMLEGAQITPEEYNANKSNLLGENAVGAKMRKFLAYALNNPSVKPGGGPINPSKVDEEILKNFKSSVILPSTPLIPEKAAEKE